MSKFVLDCSVAISWLCDDEADDYSGMVLDLLATREAVVPAVWPFELINALLVAERKKRIKYGAATSAASRMQLLPISVDECRLEQVLTGLLPLARSSNLSAYDAAYLELSIRLGVSLATNDLKLASAARSCGVALI